MSTALLSTDDPLRSLSLFSLSLSVCFTAQLPHSPTAWEHHRSFTSLAAALALGQTSRCCIKWASSRLSPGSCYKRTNSHINTWWWGKKNTSALCCQASVWHLPDLAPFDMAQRAFHRRPISLCHHCGLPLPRLLTSYPYILLSPSSPHPLHTSTTCSTAPFKDKSHYRALLLSCSCDPSFAYIKLLSNYSVLPKRAQQRSHNAEEGSFWCN